MNFFEWLKEYAEAPQQPEIVKHAPRRYRCQKCGFENVQNTNHRGATWSWGHLNTCPKCPPHAKYPEYGGQTIWEYVGDVEESPDSDQ